MTMSGAKPKAGVSFPHDEIPQPKPRTAVKTKPGMTLFWHPTGPRLRYACGMFEISDLNPELSIVWQMSRIEMLRLGWRCIVAAMRSQ